jgi:ATP-dependent DNA ligase
VARREHRHLIDGAQLHAAQRIHLVHRLDGVVAKPEASPYLPSKRAMLKIKHSRTADCVVAGFRWYRDTQDAVGSLLLGLYNEAGVLQHVGVASSFTMAMRRELADELAPLRKNALKDHPWRDWAAANDDNADRMPGEGSKARRMPGAQSRWSAGKDLSWEALRPERVCEVKYDHLQGDRFRHAAAFLRWRIDKPPQDCRYDQLEVTTAFELTKVFAARSRP